MDCARPNGILDPPPAPSTATTAVYATLPDSPSSLPMEDPHIWGSLEPCTSGGEVNAGRIVFGVTQRRYTIGLDPSNDFSLPKLDICPTQCAIEWDGDDSSTAAVTITNLSRSGVWINNEKMNYGSSRLLRNNSLVEFGQRAQQVPGSGIRQRTLFVFRRLNVKQGVDGLPLELSKSYDIQHSLGTGAYATVVKALHVTENQWYAIKLYHKGSLKSSRARFRGASDAMNVTRVRREVEVLSRLRHPNIVQFKEAVYGDDCNNISIVMEFVKGGDLKTYLATQPSGTLTEVAAIPLVSQICEALVYLHGERVVHRDLKPENILLTEDKLPIVKLADFGTAKLLHSATFLKTHCGTPLYMAPEVTASEYEAYDDVVDSWSLGVTVAVMLCGCSPFVDDNTKVINHRLFEECRVSMYGLQFVHQLLRYDPGERISSMTARQHPWLCQQPYPLLSRREDFTSHFTMSPPQVLQQQSLHHQLLHHGTEAYTSSSMDAHAIHAPIDPRSPLPIHFHRQSSGPMARSIPHYSILSRHSHTRLETSNLSLLLRPTIHISSTASLNLIPELRVVRSSLRGTKRKSDDMHADDMHVGYRPPHRWLDIEAGPSIPIFPGFLIERSMMIPVPPFLSPAHPPSRYYVDTDHELPHSYHN